MDFTSFCAKPFMKNDARQGIGKFYDNSKGKIGRQKLGNSVQFMSAIKTPWNGENWTNDKIRIELKKVFFDYINHVWRSLLFAFIYHEPFILQFLMFINVIDWLFLR
jgi:hypothetical protein